MLYYISVCIITALAGIAHGVCGFGAGIVMMTVLPSFFSISQSAAIVGVVCIALTSLMILRYRKHVSPRKVILPLIVYSAASAAAIHFSSAVDQALLKRAFGVFLLVLAAYHFMPSRKQHAKWSLPVSIAAWVFSGVCSGLFSVGGPLMVLYYLSHTDSKEEYLGTTELLFLISHFVNAYMRVRDGILTPALTPAILMCVVCICAGLFIANRIVDKTDGDKLKNIVYIGVTVSGAVNLLGL